jgi:hypothetical protein
MRSEQSFDCSASVQLPVSRVRLCFLVGHAFTAPPKSSVMRLNTMPRLREVPRRRQLPPEVFPYAFSEAGSKIRIKRLSIASNANWNWPARRATREIAANRGKLPRPPNVEVSNQHPVLAGVNESRNQIRMRIHG